MAFSTRFWIKTRGYFFKKEKKQPENFTFSSFIGLVMTVGKEGLTD